MTTKIDQAHDDDTIDLNALLGTLLDHKWLIVAITGTFFVAGVLYSLLATPIYQATAIVQVEQKTPSLPGLSDLTQSLGTTASQATTEIALDHLATGHRAGGERPAPGHPDATPAHARAGRLPVAKL